MRERQERNPERPTGGRAGDLRQRVDPAHTALLTQEIQRGVIGDLSPLAELAAAARAVLPALAELVRVARSAGVPVVHCTAERRPDGFGASRNARIFRFMERAPHPLTPGSEAAALVPEVPVEPEDLVMARLHGLSPFHGTELDAVLRNRGVRTVVAVGVSLNVAIPALAFDAVNAAYQVVIPRDAVAGFPPAYADAVLEHSLGAVATVVECAALRAAWSDR